MIRRRSTNRYPGTWGCSRWRAWPNGTGGEFRLLDYLARHPGRVFSRDHLLDAVWGDARFVTPRSVDVYVRRIREKIEADAETPRYLKTMRGAGYRFEIPKTAPAGD